MLEKNIKLVTFFFLSSFTYYLLVFFVQAEKEWDDGKEMGILLKSFFILRMTIISLFLVKGFPWTNKIAILLSRWQSQSEKEILFGARKPILSRVCRLLFQSKAYWEIVIFCIYLFYSVSTSFLFLFIYDFDFLFSIQSSRCRQQTKRLDITSLLNNTHGYLDFKFQVWIYDNNRSSQETYRHTSIIYL